MEEYRVNFKNSDVVKAIQNSFRLHYDSGIPTVYRPRYKVKDETVPNIHLNDDSD